MLQDRVETGVGRAEEAGSRDKAYDPKQGAYESIRLCCNKFGPKYPKRLKNGIKVSAIHSRAPQKKIFRGALVFFHPLSFNSYVNCKGL